MTDPKYKTIKVWFSTYRELKKLAAERPESLSGLVERLIRNERELEAARPLVDAVVAYFNKRGVTHSERKGNEDIAAMADALADYGYAVNLIEKEKRPVG